MTYLLPCPQCGEKKRVTAAMAGDTLFCASCGQRLEVPTFRELRTLEEVQDEAIEPTQKWTQRHSVIFLGLVIMIFALGLGLTLRARGPVDDEEFYIRQAEQFTPAESWEQWANNFRNGVRRAKPLEREKELEKRERVDQDLAIWEWVCYAVAGAALLVAVVGWFLPTDSGRSTARPRSVARASAGTRS